MRPEPRLTRPHTGKPSTRTGDEIMPKLLPSIEEDYNEVVANAGGDTGSHLVRNVNASLKNIGAGHDSTTDLRPVVSSQMLYPSAPNASEQVLPGQL